MALTVTIATTQITVNGESPRTVVTVHQGLQGAGVPSSSTPGDGLIYEGGVWVSRPLTAADITGLTPASSPTFAGLTVTGNIIVGGSVDGRDVGADGATLDAHVATVTGNPHSVTKADVGLGNCNNTSDLAKPISTATQAALNLKANINNPSFTGQALFADGTQLAPGIAFASLPAAGFYLYAASSIGVALAGAHLFTFTPSGTFGIGTTVPSQTLHVVGTGIRLDDSPDPVIQIKSNKSVGVAGSANLTFHDVSGATQAYLKYDTFTDVFSIGVTGGTDVISIDNLGALTFGQAILFASGSAALPGITFTGDLNTGIFHIAPDILGFATAGVEAMRINIDGNLGIGTASPSTRLQIGDATVSTLNKITFGKTVATAEAALPTICHGNITGGNGNDLLLSANSTSGLVVLQSGGTPVLVVRNDDRVGIGANFSTPDGTLHVHTNTAGTVTASGNANTIVAETNTNGGISILTPATSYGAVMFGSPTHTQQGIMLYNHATNKMQWYTVTALRMTLDGSGQLGIGTNSPGNILHIASGTVQIDGGQIKFPATQVPSADANTLDDYEENTATVAIVGLTVGGVGTYTTQTLRYTKIGNCVNYTIDLVWTAHTGTGFMQIQGLPFVNGGSTSPAAVYASNFLFTAGKQLSAVVTAGVAKIDLWEIDPAGGAASQVTMDTAGTLRISGSYFV